MSNDDRELIAFLGFVFGGAFGLIFTSGSVCVLTNNPSKPDWIGFSLTLILGLLLLLIAYVSYEGGMRQT